MDIKPSAEASVVKISADATVNLNATDSLGRAKIAEVHRKGMDGLLDRLQDWWCIGHPEIRAERKKMAELIQVAQSQEEVRHVLAINDYPCDLPLRVIEADGAHKLVNVANTLNNIDPEEIKDASPYDVPEGIWAKLIEAAGEAYEGDSQKLIAMVMEHEVKNPASLDMRTIGFIIGLDSDWLFYIEELAEHAFTTEYITTDWISKSLEIPVSIWGRYIPRFGCFMWDIYYSSEDIFDPQRDDLFKYLEGRKEVLEYNLGLISSFEEIGLCRPGCMDNGIFVVNNPYIYRKTQHKDAHLRPLEFVRDEYKPHKKLHNGIFSKIDVSILLEPNNQVLANRYLFQHLIFEISEVGWTTMKLLYGKEL